MSHETAPLPIPQKIAKRTQREIEFICRQLLRFAKMPAKEHMAYLRKHPNESFCCIPHPDGRGHYHCGALAWDKLKALNDLVIDLNPALGRRVGHGRTIDAIIDAFVHRILREGREVTLECVTLVLQDALETLKRSLAVTEHFLPCVLFLNGGPDQFSIGPVTFVRRTKFFKDRKESFRHSVAEETKAHIEHVNTVIARGFARERAYGEDESKQLVRRLHARAIKTYRGYPWIACVKVTHCDEETSGERAARTVEMALHVIRVMLGAEATRKLRLAWSSNDALRTAHMRADAHGVIRMSIGTSAIGPVGTQNWHEILMQGDHALAVLGSALAPLVAPIQAYHLHERLIDAINWFGDAAHDTAASSSIVKYVSSIERLFFGKRHRDRKQVFAKRVKGVLAAFGCDDNGDAYAHALEVYDVRSALLHGTYSPRDEAAQQVVFHAEQVSRMCLLCSAQLYPMMLSAYGNPDPSQLETVLERVTEEGIDWLAQKAGCTISSRAS